MFRRSPWVLRGLTTTTWSNGASPRSGWMRTATHRRPDDFLCRPFPNTTFAMLAFQRRAALVSIHASSSSSASSHGATGFFTQQRVGGSAGGMPFGSKGGGSSASLLDDDTQALDPELAAAATYIMRHRMQPNAEAFYFAKDSEMCRLCDEYVPPKQRNFHLVGSGPRGPSTHLGREIVLDSLIYWGKLGYSPRAVVRKWPWDIFAKFGAADALIRGSSSGHGGELSSRTMSHHTPGGMKRQSKSSLETQCDAVGDGARHIRHLDGPSSPRWSRCDNGGSVGGAMVPIPLDGNTDSAWVRLISLIPRDDAGRPDLNNFDARAQSVNRLLHLFVTMGILNIAVSPHTEASVQSGGVSLIQSRVAYKRRVTFERLELIGDNAWGSHLSQRMMAAFPDKQWADSQMHHSYNAFRDLVESNANLEAMYDLLRLDMLLPPSVRDIVGAGKIKADVFEAVIGELSTFAWQRETQNWHTEVEITEVEPSVIFDSLSSSRQLGTSSSFAGGRQLLRLASKVALVRHTLSEIFDLTFLSLVGRYAIGAVPIAEEIASKQLWSHAVRPLFDAGTQIRTRRPDYNKNFVPVFKLPRLPATYVESFTAVPTVGSGDQSPVDGGFDDSKVALPKVVRVVRSSESNETGDGEAAEADRPVMLNVFQQSAIQSQTTNPASTGRRAKRREDETSSEETPMTAVDRLKTFGPAVNDEGGSKCRVRRARDTLDQLAASLTAPRSEANVAFRSTECLDDDSRTYDGLDGDGAHANHRVDDEEERGSVMEADPNGTEAPDLHDVSGTAVASPNPPTAVDGAFDKVFPAPLGETSTCGPLGARASLPSTLRRVPTSFSPPLPPAKMPAEGEAVRVAEDSRIEIFPRVKAKLDAADRDSELAAEISLAALEASAPNRHKCRFSTVSLLPLAGGKNYYRISFEDWQAAWSRDDLVALYFDTTTVDSIIVLAQYEAAEQANRASLKRHAAALAAAAAQDEETSAEVVAQLQDGAAATTPTTTTRLSMEVDDEHQRIMAGASAINLVAASASNNSTAADAISDVRLAELQRDIERQRLFRAADGALVPLNVASPNNTHVPGAPSASAAAVAAAIYATADAAQEIDFDDIKRRNAARRKRQLASTAAAAAVENGDDTFFKKLK